MKKVCLDPGHGVETPGKRSPDGTYREHEFALDMAGRIKAILERHGVAVTLTRTTEKDVSLAQRVKTANAIQGLDLFLSLHSNAAGSGGEWKNARGYTVYTSGEDDSAGRNKAAKAILARAKEAGITVRNGGRPNYNGALYVLHHTKAPACLIEHLFHDNREDVALLKDDGCRQLLATADAKGILDYLGIPWSDKEIGAATGSSDSVGKEGAANDPQLAPTWYAQAAGWVKEMGLADGTRPEDTCTRAEVWVMLERLYDVVKKEK